MIKKLLSDKAYLILQMGFGTFIVGMSTIFWQYESARPTVLLYFAVGLVVILHTIYRESKMTDVRIKKLESELKSLKESLGLYDESPNVLEKV
jgi:hypothetical protein